VFPVTVCLYNLCSLSGIKKRGICMYLMTELLRFYLWRLNRKTYLSKVKLFLYFFPGTCPSMCFVKGLFSFQKFLQRFLHSPSHLILQYMHKALNLLS